jgi:hypothetical protein
MLPREYHFDAVTHQEKLEERKSEQLGCIRFIASLSRVDGFVLMDKSLVVHGFGVETRAYSELADIYIAANPQATLRLLRQVPLSQFGTRHRAMMRYCYEHEGALGFVISQDGDIRATMQLGGRLVLWENINVQLAFRTENRAAITNFEPITGLFQSWGDSLFGRNSA